MTYGTTTGSSNYISNAAPVYGVNQHQINYGNGNPSYAGAVQEATSNVSQQRKQRARVPPPSKVLQKYGLVFFKPKIIVYNNVHIIAKFYFNFIMKLSI